MLQLLYSKVNQSLPSTIFNQAHNGKLYSEHRQQGTQLHNFITRKLLYKNSCLNTLWKEEDIYYKTSHIINIRYGLYIDLKHVAKLNVLTEQVFSLNPVPNGQQTLKKIIT
jgi:PPE-repeat protein